MDFSGVSFTSASDNVLDFDGNANFSSNGVFSEMYPSDGLVGDSFVSATDTFSNIGESFVTQSESFSTAADYPPDGREDDYDLENGEWREKHVILMDGEGQYGVSCTVFDDIEELVWSGNSMGHVTSYYSSDMMKYTSFHVHDTEDIRDILPIDAGVLIATPTTLNMTSRQGVPQFTKKDDAFENLQCILQSEYANKLLIGGHQSNLIEYDLTKMETAQLYNVGENGCVILREHNRFICHGDKTGKIHLHDPRTMKQEHSFQAHTSTLSDFDVHRNYIATCGFSSRMGQMMGDPFIMIFDTRMMKMALPLRSMLAPYFIRFVPALSSCLVSMSSIGQWSVVDVAQPENSVLPITYQATLPHSTSVTSLDVSSSSQALVLGGSSGYLNLFTAGNKPVFNRFSVETVWPRADENVPLIPITDRMTSLGIIPLPLSDTPLLSDWPSHLMQTPYWPTPPIDSKILSSMMLTGGVAYVQNTFNMKRNQVPYNLKKGSKTTEGGNGKKDEVFVHVPRRYRRIEVKYSKLGFDEFDFDAYNRTSFAGLDMSLPNSYCNSMLQMLYYIEPLRISMLSHLCDREFCLSCELGFLFHMLDISGGNQGIPCHASNFLRAFRTIPEVAAMSLTISDQDTRSKTNLASKIQSWNCFVLQQVHSETVEEREGDLPPTLDLTGGEYKKEMKGEFRSVAEDIFGAKTIVMNTCIRCGCTTQNEIMSQTVKLVFPDNANEEAKSVEFSSLIENAMRMKQSTQAWCERCTKYQPMEQFRTYKCLPNVISVNCGLDSASSCKFWEAQHEIALAEFQEKLRAEMKNSDNANDKESEKLRTSPTDTSSPWHQNKTRPCRYGAGCIRVDCRFQHPARDKDDPSSVTSGLIDQAIGCSWVPPALKVVLDEDGNVTLSDVPKNQMDSTETDGEILYDLVSVVAHISDPKLPDKNNLVTCIKVGPTYHTRAKVSSVSHWYLFNDISIQPIGSDEAIWFPYPWKVPCVMFWMRRHLPPSLAELTIRNPISVDVFTEDKSVAQRGRKRITFTPLTAEEIPQQDELIAMDAEFVNLHQEEAEIRSDGTKNTIKPSHKSVARITCIRGHGPLESTPFIDDYISTQEQVVDYLTQFSGIKPGDLDANYSQKNLTTLKSTYVKLRYMVDRGVKIIGHGLKNDLRVINIAVPQGQLIDTVQLFHLPHYRMVSLKFLAWHFLKVKIQSVTHDSIEDARTALALHQTYLHLKEIDCVVIELQQMYEAGKKCQWKVPGDDEPIGWVPPEFVSPWIHLEDPSSTNHVVPSQYSLLCRTLCSKMALYFGYF